MGIWGWISEIMLGIAKMAKAIFGMSKPKEVEINEIGETDKPKSDPDSVSKRKSWMRGFSWTRHKGSSDTDTYDYQTGEDRGKGTD